MTDQRTFNFDLAERLGKADRMDAPAATRKLLRALILFAERQPERVVTGEVDGTEEWVVDPSREEIAAAAGVTVVTAKRWIRSARDLRDGPIAVCDVVGRRCHYVIHWRAMTRVSEQKGGQNDPGQGGQNDPGQGGQGGQNDPGQGGQNDPGQGAAHSSYLDPTKDLELKTTTTTKKPTSAARQNFFEGGGERKRRAIGITIRAEHFRRRELVPELVAAAERQGFTTAEERRELIAFCVWLAEQAEDPTGAKPGSIKTRPGLYVDALDRGREAWAFRAAEEHFAVADQILAKYFRPAEPADQPSPSADREESARGQRGVMP